MKQLRLLLVLLAAVFMFACSNRVLIRDRERNDMSLFYGYVGFDSDNSSLTNFIVKKLDTDSDKPYYWCGTYRGVFFEYLSPGSYRVEKFISVGSCGYNCTQTNTYQLPTQDNGFVITKPSLYFFTSVRIKNKIEGEWFNAKEKYEVEKADWPSEEQIIERLLDIVEPGSNMERALWARLKQYRNLRAANATKKIK